MAKNPAPRKVVTTRPAAGAKARVAQEATPMLFGKRNFLFIGIGLGLILLGCLLMLGGGMPDPDTWDPDRIYSFRRITLAPIVILAGLAVEVYAIFTRPE